MSGLSHPGRSIGCGGRERKDLPLLTRKGVLKSFDSGNYLATIQISGSLSVWLEGVPVARNIPSAEMIAGRNCATIFFDPSNPKDGVVIAVYV